MEFSFEGEVTSCEVSSFEKCCLERARYEVCRKFISAKDLVD